MKYSTLDKIIFTQVEGCLQVTMIQEDKYMEVLCYFSPEFIILCFLIMMF